MSLLPLPIRCLNGHVIARVDLIKKFQELQQQDVPMHEILDRMGFADATRQCCRVQFMTCPLKGKI